jgi:hypothetical protein
MTTEALAQSELRLFAAQQGHALWRNNSGAMYNEQTKRMIRFGLGNDSARVHDVFKSSDLIGYTVVKVTPEMVGRHVAVFSSVEVKKPEWTKPTNSREYAQANFVNSVSANGGIGLFATSTKDYMEKINEYLHQTT